jgi:hypothetical protein
MYFGAKVRGEFMQGEERKPKTQSAGAMPPPRPPTRTAIGLGPDDDDDDDSIKRRKKKETVRINLPPGDPTTAPMWPPFTVYRATRFSARAQKLFSAALVLMLQGVLVFEACSSVDRTTAILFLIVTVVLSIPGYAWAFESSIGANLRKPMISK